MSLDHTTNQTSVKLCECGCGQPAPIAKKTETRKGWIKGKPMRFVSGHYAKTRPILDEQKRFWRFVDKRQANDCWKWTGGVTQAGYGGFHTKDHDLAHRYSYELHHGLIPKGLFVCHRCDNPACVNPSHLFLGSPADNSKDMVKKSRHWVPSREGSKNGHSKLTDNDIREIRNLRAQGIKENEVAKRFGVSISTISSIKNGRSWSHIP